MKPGGEPAEGAVSIRAIRPMANRYSDHGDGNPNEPTRRFAWSRPMFGTQSEPRASAIRAPWLPAPEMLLLVNRLPRPQTTAPDLPGIAAAAIQRWRR